LVIFLFVSASEFLVILLFVSASEFLVISDIVGFCLFQRVSFW
jgi:hypothetical protein